MRRFYGKLITDPNVQHGMIGNLERMSGAFRGNPGSRYWRDTQSVEGARNAAAGWHRVHRLAGHPSREVTDGMVRSGKFGRIAMPDERDKFCEVCARAAFTRPPVIHSGSPRTKRIGKRWHANLAGPFKRDRNGVEYVMNIVDDTTGYVYATGLKSKKDALPEFTRRRIHGTCQSLEVRGFSR